ncbi:hypothetical protein BV25DRAFT_144107 [Artomyces pyxidatus]|uniref:Uncharacterized protein n=1 Tax=Artomyces pyxidatus TaxID=48021 RepID=A0ACB8T8H7_9AGAM|nr:hypothetical protein BV25DRAFT_144107 [Artomyces pyxidatus]
MTSIRSRADGFRSLNIVLSSELATKAFSTSFLSSTFGGQNRRRERVTTASYSSMTGYKDFLYLKHAHQPFAPLQPGEPGILLTTAQRGDSWPEYEKVLVSMPPGALVCKFVYAGEYELRGGAPLTAEELCSLHPEVILHWARHILKSSAAHCMTMRARVWFRKEKGREPTPQQIENMVNHTHGVTISDIVTALKQGKEQLFAWGMLPAWYEPCFQRLLLSVEEGQEEMAVTGRLLQVRTSRRARVVTDKAKMVPTARHRKRRREIDSDADDIEVIE